MPSDVASLMQSWQEQNPRYEYELFDREACRKYLLKNYGDDVLNLFDRAKFPAMMSDIFRVAYCLHDGGVYIDSATKSVAALDPVLGDRTKLVLMRKWHGAIWNGFIASPPGNPLLQKIWDRILLNLKDRQGDNVWAVTGPGVFTSVLPEGGVDCCIVQEQAKLKIYFDLVNDLGHKKAGHWSERQKNESIFTDSEE